MISVPSGGLVPYSNPNQSVMNMLSVPKYTVNSGPIANGPLLRVQYWRFGGYFQTVHRSHADSPPRPRGQPAWCLWTVRMVSVDSPLMPRGTVRPVLADGLPGLVLSC
jgi:hypothetical protein